LEDSKLENFNQFKGKKKTTYRFKDYTSALDKSKITKSQRKIASKIAKELKGKRQDDYQTEEQLHKEEENSKKRASDAKQDFKSKIAKELKSKRQDDNQTEEEMHKEEENDKKRDSDAKQEFKSKNMKQRIKNKEKRASNASLRIKET